MILSKLFLNVNGVERMFVCDYERDSLADVLRKMGFTSVKVGCGRGQCGACSVLLNGKVVRSCTKKIKYVEQYSTVTTVEGIGTPQALHPLQQAWITYNGTQCGFCAPGFIVSAKGLLDENPNPTREEVRAWFQRHRNACRCTGYKVLVDAVMEAAKVLRGEKTMEEITYQAPEGESLYGSKYPRPAALAKVTGSCDYGDDINSKLPDGMAYLAPVLARVNHGIVRGIDFEEALDMPGVIKVITHSDVKGTNRVVMPIGKARSLAQGNEQPILNEDIIYRYGDVVAMVAATSQREARDAAAKVVLDIEPLPAYMSALEAVSEDAMEIHQGIPNLFLEQPHFFGEDTKDIIEKAAYAVSENYYTQRQPHLVLEPEAGLAYIDEEGDLVIQYKSQTLYMQKGAIAGGIGVPAEKIRIVANNAGGSFGYSMSPTYPALLAVGALALKRPCAMTMTFEEHQHYTPKRAPAFCNATLAADEEGRLTAFEYELAYDVGPYTQFAGPLLDKGPTFMGFPYRIPNAKGLTKEIYTNHNYNTTYRSYGVVTTTFITESLVDELAAKMGQDPLEFRYKNVLRPGEVCLAGHPLDSYLVTDLIDRLRPRYEKALARAKEESTAERKIGVGVALSTYKSGGGVNDQSEIYLELNPDGSVTHYNSWEDMGQGADVGTLIHTHEALKPLGLAPEQIHLVQNDTRYCPNSGPAAGSRSHYMNGNATIDAANKLMSAMRKEDGSYRTYDEMVAEGIPTKYSGIFSTSDMTDMSNLDPNTGLGKNASVNSYAVMMAVVAVETATGKVKVLSVDGEADIGRVGSYQAVEGQAHSAILHGIGLALSEDYEDMDRGGTMIGCGFPYIADTPDHMDVRYLETDRPTGPQGSAGCSEPLQSGPAAAVINAVYQACGARLRELPAMPAKVLEALKLVKEGKNQCSDPYFLGCDFEEHMEDLKNNPL